MSQIEVSNSSSKEEPFNVREFTSALVNPLHQSQSKMSEIEASNSSSKEEPFNVGEFTSALVNSVIYEEEINQLKEKVIYLEAENEKVRDKGGIISDKAEEIENLQLDIKKRDMHIASFKSDRERDRNEIRALKQKLHKLKSEQEELQSVSDENEIAFREIEELKEKLNKQHNDYLKFEEAFQYNYKNELQQLKMAKQEVDKELHAKKLELAQALRKSKQCEEQVEKLKIRIQFLEKEIMEQKEETLSKKMRLNENDFTSSIDKENLISSTMKQVDFSGLSFKSPFPAFNNKGPFYSPDLKEVSKTYVDLSYPQGRLHMYDQAKISRSEISRSSSQRNGDDGDENENCYSNDFNQKNTPFLRVGLSKKSRIRRPLHDTN